MGMQCAGWNWPIFRRRRENVLQRCNTYCIMGNHDAPAGIGQPFSRSLMDVQTSLQTVPPMAHTFAIALPALVDVFPELLSAGTPEADVVGGDEESLADDALTLGWHARLIDDNAECLSGKRPYLTWNGAHKAIRAFRLRPDAKRERWCHFSAYRCGRCRHWHVGNTMNDRRPRHARSPKSKRQ